jgi:UDP-N-acetylglucosamine 2-epimerase (non-hydrolysing)
MIVIIYGTAGELIKLAPLLKAIPEKSYLTISTEQQPGILQGIRDDFNLQAPDYRIANGYRGQGISKSWHFLLWVPTVLWNLVKLTPKIRKIMKADIGKLPLVVIHGDTVTSLISAFYAIVNGYKIGHIEAGLRSHDLMNPFPEELDRRIISKLAKLHFAPGDIPLSNLKKENATGVMINTGGNTVVDSIQLSAATRKESVGLLDIPAEYGLVSLRRNEFLAKPELVKSILLELNESSKNKPLLFIDYPLTKKRIHELEYDSLFTSDTFMRVPSQSYFAFMKLLLGASFVVTDSGGIQEECAHLNIPCILHRHATERQDGIGANVVLSRFKMEVVKEFLSHPEKHKKKVNDSLGSPTEIIIEYLKKESYI